MAASAPAAPTWMILGSILPGLRCWDGGFCGRVPRPPPHATGVVPAERRADLLGEAEAPPVAPLPPGRGSAHCAEGAPPQLVFHTRRFRAHDAGVAPGSLWSLWGPSERMQEQALRFGQDLGGTGLIILQIFYKFQIFVISGTAHHEEHY